VVRFLLIPKEGQDPPRAVVLHKGSPLQEDSHLDKDPLQVPCPLQALCPLVLLKAVILKGLLLDVIPNLSSTACRAPLMALHLLCSLAVRHHHNSHTHNKYPLLNNSSQRQDVSDTLVYLDSSSRDSILYPFYPLLVFFFFFLVFDTFIGVMSSLTLD
jgi:hypothetical protein